MQAFLRSCKYYCGYAFFFSMFINLLQLTFSIYMLQVYDKVLTSYNLPTLWVITAAAVVALATLALLDWTRARLLTRASIDLDDRLGALVVEQSLVQASNSLVPFEGASSRDVQTLRNYIAGSAITAYFDIPWMPLYFIIIFVLHPLLGAVALVGGLCVLMLGVLQQQLNKKNLVAANEVTTQSAEFLASGLRNADTVKAMGMVGAITRRWLGMNDRGLELQTRARLSAGMLHSAGKSLRLAMQVFIYAAGAYLAVTHASTPGIMIAASIIMGRALAPLDMAMASYQQSIEAKNAYGRLRRAAERPSAPVESMALPEPEGHLSFETVDLAVNGRPVIRQLSFALPAGHSLAVIGPSASGKSTLCRLLLGIWRPTRGTVRIDQADIASWDSERLGRYIGYLPQDVELFSGTVAENIARMSEVDSGKVIEAAKLAGVHALILNLPDGYDTLVGRKGEALSGGQRQRLGLARALYGNPRIVVLDEPNSNLDEEGEKTLMHTLAALKQRAVTVLMVTHKPAVLSMVDSIMVLQAGQIAAYGPRQDVLAKMEAVRKQQQQFLAQQAAARQRQEALFNAGGKAV